MLLWVFLSIAAGSPVIPEKLRLYQNLTGIDDLKLMSIFEKSLQGKHLRLNTGYHNEFLLKLKDDMTTVFRNLATQAQYKVVAFWKVGAFQSIGILRNSM